MNREELKQRLKDEQDQNVDFGTDENGPSENWVKAAEEELGTSLPESYLWFLKSFGGGEIYGTEIHSIYEMPFDEVVGGDVVVQTRLARSQGFIGAKDISICNTDFGEIFVLDCGSSADTGDAPVVRVTGGKREKYAENFVEFVSKFLDG